VPGFDTTIDHAKAIQQLARLYWRRRIPNALLFSGIEGIGKGQVAVLFAQTCNCLNQNHFDPELNRQTPEKIEACGECRACRKIASNSHPDIIHVNPTGRFIKIAQIREIRDYLAFRPNEAQLRVVILQKAQTLNLEAGNALLKMLEEPPDQTIFILITSHEMDLLPTIRSRCQQIRFRPIAQKRIEAYLNDEKQRPVLEASVVSSYANGSLQKAEAYTDGRWIDKRNWLIESLGMIPSHVAGHRFLKELFAVAEELTKEKAIIEDYINIIRFWLRDIIVCRYHTGYVLNKDRLSDLIKVSEQIQEISILKMMTELDNTMIRIEANTNARLTIENLLLKWAGLLSNAQTTLKNRSI
jgi:DNA polymerase-3 subunit delta'